MKCRADDCHRLRLHHGEGHTVAASARGAEDTLLPESIDAVGRPHPRGLPSEVDLGPEFEHARGQNLLGVQPGRTVPAIEQEDGARVEHIVNIEHPLHAGPSHSEDPGQANIELVLPWVECRHRT